MYRGLGMDAAALSGRLASKAIEKVEKTGGYAIDYYQKYMGKHVRKIRKKTAKSIIKYKTNEDLLHALKKSAFKMGIATFFASIINKFLSADKTILLPI